MPLPHNKNLSETARKLRRATTPEENKLWYQYLKTFPYTVRRQKVILNYIVDFYIDSHKLVIELDGRQHLTPEHRENDEKRDRELLELGIRVLRYPNRLIHTDFYMICLDIAHHCGLYMHEG